MFATISIALLVLTQAYCQAPPAPDTPGPAPIPGIPDPSSIPNGFSNDCPPGAPPGDHCFQMGGTLSTKDLPAIIPNSKKDTGALLDVGRLATCMSESSAIAKSKLDIPCLACNCRNYAGLCWPQKWICSSTVAKYDNPPVSPPGEDK